ncbi:MAG: hypothetical protein HZA53_06755 [Planctomycetes bacterium]|nr:hypothetical protein [Planctomycetota bacterium]
MHSFSRASIAALARLQDLARWRDNAWSPFSAGPIPNGAVRALARFDDGLGGGPDLYLGGEFTSIGGRVSMGVAAWRGCDDPGVPFCFGDGSGSACPCGNTGAIGHGCANSANANDALLTATGAASLANDTLVLDGTGMPAAAPAFCPPEFANWSNGFRATWYP